MGFCFFGFRLTVVVGLLLQMSDVVQSGATLELLINNFQNPTEKAGNGDSCDQFWIGECDPKFYFGCDQSSGNANDARQNFYGTRTTGTFQDQNNVNFGSNMNGVANPMLWTFSSWPGAVYFKCYVEDDDQPYTPNDYLDGLVQSLTLTPAKTKSSASSTNVIINGLRSSDKTSMSVTYKLYCDESYYGSWCSVYCVAQNSQSGHYTCDPDTGEKVCTTGYQNPSTNCTTVLP